MKIKISDLAEAAKEGELTLEWFTDKQVMLDDMGELGFSTYHITQLKAELDLVRQVIFPNKEELYKSWLMTSGTEPS